MVNFQINIVASISQATRSLNQLQRGLRQTQATAAKVQGSIQRALTGIGFALGAQQVIRFADAYTNLRNRLRTVISDEEELTRVQERLLAISNENRASFEDTANLFQRLTSAVRNLGVGQEELLTIVDSVGKGIALSGANSIEASNALRQLTQGLGSGALKGDELRSVLEQLPTIADLIARRLGVSREQLKKLGEQSKITTAVIIDAFRDARTELVENFAKTVPTIGQAFEVLSNQFIKLAGTANESTGVFTGLAEGILVLSNNLETLARAATVLVGALGLRGLLGVALRIASPLGILVTGASFLGFQLLELSAKAKAASENFTQFADANDRLAQNLERTAKIIRGLNQKDLERLGLLIDAQGRLATGSLPGLVGPGGEVVKPARPGRVIGRSITGQEPSPAQLASIGAAAQGIVRTLTPVERISRQALRSISEGLNAAKAGFEGATQAAQAFVERTLAVSGAFNQLQGESKVFEAIIDGNEEIVELLEIQNQLRAQGITLTSAEAARLGHAIAQTRALQDQALALQNLVGEQEALRREEIALQALTAKRPDLINQIIDRMEVLRLRSLETSTALEDGFERAFIKLKREGEDFAAVGEKIVGVFADNLTNALVEFAETGKLSFKDLARSIVNDLIKIIARLLVVQALSAIFAPAGPTPVGPAGLPFSFFPEGREHGGPVRGDRSYVVGEKRPEIFVPGRSGTVLPSVGGGEPPTVNLQVVNVDDPNSVPQAIASGRADQSFLNLLARNRNAVKQTLGI